MKFQGQTMIAKTIIPGNKNTGLNISFTFPANMYIVIMETAIIAAPNNPLHNTDNAQKKYVHNQNKNFFLVVCCIQYILNKNHGVLYKITFVDIIHYILIFAS